MKVSFAWLMTLSILLISPALWAADVVETNQWDALLSEYVDAEGQVDYARWHQSEQGRENLDAFLDKVAQASPDEHSDKAQLAFYINAYNATVIKSVLDEWPVQSVMKVDGFFKTQKHLIARKRRTLDELEHKLIRPRFDEPRIHFVLVCAAKSCPRLRQEAMSEENLEEALEKAVAEFIPQVTSLKGKTVTTSQLLNWFADDFKKEAGSVEAYLARYVSPRIKEALTSGEVTLQFDEYDWELNKQ